MTTKNINDNISSLQQANNVPGTTQNDITYLPSKYSKAFNSYSRNHIKLVMPFIASISRTCSYSSLYPICKVLKAISKIFMLNQIEVIFLAYLIRQTQWDIKDKTIYHNAENVQDIIYYSIDNLDYKRIILYLMVTAFTVKYYLNESTNDILEQINKRCPNFKQIFQGWNKKHATIITKINPRTLNAVYKKLYSSVKADQLDFNMMVDAIIQISPAYNPQRQKGGQQNKKKNQKKQQQQVYLKKQDFAIKADKNTVIISGNAMFSSSGLLNMINLHNQQPNNNQNQNTQNIQNNVSGMNPFMINRSDRIRQQYLGIMGSSVVGGLQQNYDIKQDEDCGELVLGLHDGQSEENIIFEDKGNIQNNSIANVGSSIGGFQLYMNQSNINQANPQQPVTQQSPYYTSIINLTRKGGNDILGRDNLGSSQIMLLSSAVNPIAKNKIQAAIVSYPSKNTKDKNQL